jgi:hypothetical protein
MKKQEFIRKDRKKIIQTFLMFLRALIIAFIETIQDTAESTYLVSILGVLRTVVSCIPENHHKIDIQSFISFCRGESRKQKRKGLNKKEKNKLKKIKNRQTIRVKRDKVTNLRIINRDRKITLDSRYDLLRDLNKKRENAQLKDKKAFAKKVHAVRNGIKRVEKRIEHTKILLIQEQEIMRKKQNRGPVSQYKRTELKKQKIKSEYERTKDSITMLEKDRYYFAENFREAQKKVVELREEVQRVLQNSIPGREYGKSLDLLKQKIYSMVHDPRSCIQKVEKLVYQTVVDQPEPEEEIKIVRVVVEKKPFFQEQTIEEWLEDKPEEKQVSFADQMIGRVHGLREILEAEKKEKEKNMHKSSIKISKVFESKPMEIKMIECVLSSTGVHANIRGRCTWCGKDMR